MSRNIFDIDGLPQSQPPQPIEPGSTARMDPIPEPEPEPKPKSKPKPKPGDGNGPSKGIIAVIVCALVIACVIAVIAFASSRTSGQESQESPAPSSESSESAPEIPAPEAADVKALVTLVGDEDANKLVAQAKTSEDAAWIIANLDSFAFDGPEVQTKIIRLAANEPAAIGYVRNFPAQYPQKKADMSLAPVADEAEFKDAKLKTSVPHLFQWDPRWAYVEYSSATFGLTGCGPTSMAMIYQGITGKTDLSPYDMSVRAQQAGFMSEFNGTATAFFYYEAAQDGFTCYDLLIDAESITSTLKDGNLIIANLGPGYFTEGGHFFVLSGLTSDGKVIVNDPYSKERSLRTWDANFIASESIALFAFSKDAPAATGNGYGSGNEEGAYDNSYDNGYTDTVDSYDTEGTYDGTGDIDASYGYTGE